MNPNINPAVMKQFLASRIENQQEHYVHPPYDLEKKLLYAIQIANKKRAKSVLIEINALTGATLANNPIRSKKNALIAHCTLFTRAIIKGGVNPELAFHLSDAFILEVEKKVDVQQLQQLEYDMLLQFIEAVKNEQTTKKYGRPVRLAISYIYEHILQQLTLPTIANYVDVNESYLSHVFKKEVGMTMSTFIQKKRIEESKFFLLYSDTSISDIALLFKFCNQSYYSLQFKKYNGMTPKQFRELH